MSIQAGLRDFMEEHKFSKCDYNAMIGELIFFESNNMYDRWSVPEGTPFFKKWMYYEEQLVKEKFPSFEIYLNDDY